MLRTKIVISRSRIVGFSFKSFMLLLAHARPLSAWTRHKTRRKQLKSNSKTENAIEAADTRGDKIGPIEPWSKLDRLPSDSADEARRARLIELTLGMRGMIGIADEHSDGRMLSTVDRLANIGPQDAAESMLAELMVITHSAAVACASAAHDAGLGSPVASAHLVHFERLTTAYVAQMTMLDRRRGKAIQQVIVKRVEVTKGGQAIVGHVDARNNDSKARRMHAQESTPL